MPDRVRRAVRVVRTSRRIGITFAVAVVALCALAGTGLADGWWFASNDNAWPYAATPSSPALATVGDISCQPGAPEESESLIAKAAAVTSVLLWSGVGIMGRGIGVY